MKPVLQAKEFEGYFWIPAHIHVEEVTKAYEAGAAAEREACAKIADHGADMEDPFCCQPVANCIAKDIRARGQDV